MPLRQCLREATAAAHERLHHHPGFAAIQDGTIDLAHYRSLLVRLYGFYVPFEAAAGIAGDRSNWLRADLAAVGGYALATIPRCTSLARLDTQARQLGALYVVEGSTLGGRISPETSIGCSVPRSWRVAVSFSVAAPAPPPPGTSFCRGLLPRAVRGPPATRLWRPL
jgi:hypothetical protein